MLVEYVLSNLINYEIDYVVGGVERFILGHVRGLDLIQLSCLQLEVVEIFHLLFFETNGLLHTHGWLLARRIVVA